MPSSQLSKLTELIEAQNTDHFGKFYLYVSLLNTLVVRNRSFSQLMPNSKNNLIFFRHYPLDLGRKLPDDFDRELTPYAKQFANSDDSLFKEVILSYFSKGKLSDLVYITDQMLHHLTQIQSGVQNKNNNTFRSLKLEQGKMIEFIGQISAFNHQLLSVSDSSVNAALYVLALTLGLALTLSTSLIPILIGLPIMAVGAYGIYHYVTKAKSLIDEIPNQLAQIEEKTRLVPQDYNFNNQKAAAFYGAVLMPLPYTAVTAAKQVVPSQADRDKLAQVRSKMDTGFSKFTI